MTVASLCQANNRRLWKVGRLFLFICECEDRDDRCDQRENKSGELQKLFKGYVFHRYHLLPEYSGKRRNHTLSPVKEKATATVLVSPRALRAVGYYTAKCDSCQEKKQSRQCIFFAYLLDFYSPLIFFQYSAAASSCLLGAGV